MKALSPCTGPRHHFLAAARVDWLASLLWQVDALPRLYPWREFKPPRWRLHFAALHASTDYAFGHSFQALWQICHQIRSPL